MFDTSTRHLRAFAAMTLAVSTLTSCASQARVPAPGELEGMWSIRTLVYREDLGCIVRGDLAITGSEDHPVCTIEVRETCEVYDADKFVVAQDTCALEINKDNIVLRVADRKVLNGNPNYLKSPPHELARYELGISSDGRVLSGRYFGDWDTAVRLEKQ